MEYVHVLAASVLHGGAAVLHWGCVEKAELVLGTFEAIPAVDEIYGAWPQDRAGETPMLPG